MNITCPQCGTVYRLPDEKFKKGMRMRCSVCKHVFSAAEEAPAKLEDPLLSLSKGTDAGAGLRISEEKLPSVDGGISLSGASGDSAGTAAAKMEYPSETFSKDSLPTGSGMAAGQADEIAMPAGRSFSFSGFFSLLLCIGFGAGGWWLWMNTPYLNGIKDLVRPYIGEVAEVKTDDPLAMISQLEFRDVTQSRVKNDKIGELVVITGKVRNNFPAPRAFIRLAASLYDAEGKCLVEKRQLAGAALGKYQLESYNADELKDALESKLEIAASNTNVISGGEVPFTVVFTDVPEGASDYKVKILEAAIPRVGNLTE